jgi:hypothetical protein
VGRENPLVISFEEPQNVIIRFDDDAANRMLDNGFALATKKILAPETDGFGDFQNFIDAFNQYTNYANHAGVLLEKFSFLPVPEVQYTEADPFNLLNDKVGHTVYFDGTAHYQDSQLTVFVGGTREDGFSLDHSTFGAWAFAYTMDGTLTFMKDDQILSQPEGKFLNVYYAPVYGGVVDKKINPEEGSFTGPAIAMASQYRGDKFHNAYLYGTAALALENSGGNVGFKELYLAFPGFADFKIGSYGDEPGTGSNIMTNGLLLAGSGGGLQTGLHVIMLNAANNVTDIALQNINAFNATLETQFYGESASSAEGVGRFELLDTSGMHTSIQGSFGVKK